MIDDPEEEAWKEMEKKMYETTLSKDRHPEEVKSIQDAYADWMKETNSFGQDLFLAFKAGWVAGVRNQWAKERND